MKSIEDENIDSLLTDDETVNEQEVAELITTKELKDKIELIIKTNKIQELEDILELIAKTDTIVLVKTKIDLMYFILVSFSINYKIDNSLLFSFAKDNRFIVSTAINLLTVIKQTPTIIDYLIANLVDENLKKEISNIQTELPLILLKKNKVVSDREITLIKYYSYLSKVIKKSFRQEVKNIITEEYIVQEFNIIDPTQLSIITVVINHLLTDKEKLSGIFDNIMEKINAKL